MPPPVERRPPEHLLRPEHLFWGGLIQQAVLVGIAVVIAWFVFGDPIPFVMKLDTQALIDTIFCVVPLLAYMLFSLSPIGDAIAPIRGTYEFLKRFLGNAMCGCNAWQLSLIGLSAGFGEEILFRGVLQPWALEHMSPSAGIALTSLLFGLLHPASIAYVVVATIISAYLGWVSYLTGNLLVPILAHGIYDVVGFNLLVRKIRRERHSPTDAPPAVDLDPE